MAVALNMPPLVLSQIIIHSTFSSLWKWYWGIFLNIYFQILHHYYIFWYFFNYENLFICTTVAITVRSNPILKKWAWLGGENCIIVASIWWEWLDILGIFCFDINKTEVHVICSVFKDKSSILKALSKLIYVINKVSF